MSAQAYPSGSERSPLLPKRGVEHHEVQPGPAEEISDKPEKSQAMVMYVQSYSLSRWWIRVCSSSDRTALMVSMLLCGWNAGSLGPLLPALQSYYDVRPLLGQC